MKKTEAALYFICNIYTIIKYNQGTPRKKSWRKTFLF